MDDTDIERTPGSGPARLADLTPDQCWGLLEQVEVGRVAWCGPDGPDVVPVNLAVVEEAVWLRTSPYSRLVGHCRGGARLAVEADHVDTGRRSGWSVVVAGVGEPVDTLDVPEAVRLLDTWAPGNRGALVRLTVHRVTGRRLTARTP
ncbi:pyridoxamine 5'-phosphate oxidase family protein [Nocardioides sp. 503]|uniref:pyridoxamine 5'-phosphate oxidase family protein n=1 Tax=Nocardioides sp. 503 TaxID=2508326 RepID=UPI00106FA177|nr:pyridoxamine 5'-phosphate oxidase family protein [Nocardioides sp. 503]